MMMMIEKIESKTMQNENFVSDITPFHANMTFIAQRDYRLM